LSFVFYLLKPIYSQMGCEMKNGLIISLYCILLVIAIYNLCAEYRRKNIINAFICLQAAFILYYIFIPILVHINIDFTREPLMGFIVRISIADNYDIFYAFFYTLVAYIIILISYRITISPKVSVIGPTEIKRLANVDSHSSEVNIQYWNKRVYRIAIAAGILTLIIGVIAELVIAYSLGGIFQAIAMGDKMRAFGSDTSFYIPQNRLFVIVLMVSSLASTYFFVYGLRIYKKFIIKLLLLVSVLASTFYLLFNAGRLGIFIFLLSFFIDFVFRKTKHPFISMSLFTILLLVSLGILDDLFFRLSYGFVKESSKGILSTIDEFSFPYANLLNVHKINVVYGLRWGIDFVSWIINIVPTTILEVFGQAKITTGYTFITEYYSGANASGGTPTDLLTLGIRQFGGIGVFVVSLFISRLCKYFDKVIAKIHSDNFVFMTIRISSIMFVMVPYADIDSFIRNRYDMLMVFIFAVIVNKTQTKLNQYRTL